VYRLQQRLVDVEGYVALNSNRYSVPLDWIGRRVEVRETRDKIKVQLDSRRLVTRSRRWRTPSLPSGRGSSATAWHAKRARQCS